MGEAEQTVLRLLAEIPEDGVMDWSQWEEHEHWYALGRLVERGHVQHHAFWLFSLTEAGRDLVARPLPRGETL